MNKRNVLLVAAAALLTAGTATAQTQSKKRGIAYDFTSMADLQAVSPGVSWFYNWGTSPKEAVAGCFKEANMVHVPMTWNAGYNKNDLRNYLKSHPEVKYLLGFNEPNFWSQANLTPKQAAAKWPELEALADEFGLELVSPACNWSGDAMEEDGVNMQDPVRWLDAFFAAYPEAKVDYIGIHFYMPNQPAYEANIERLRKYGRKIWLTEFNMDKSVGDNGTADEQRDFIVNMIHYLEKEDLIFRYSWFIGRAWDNHPVNLLDKNPGELTTCGKVYTYMSSYDNSFFHQADKRIEAEHYIDMQGISLVEGTDDDGTITMGYIDDGDWAEYNIDVPAEGDYTLTLRYSGEKDAQIDVTSPASGSLLAIVNIPAAGGWDSWHTLRQTLHLQKGKQRIRLGFTFGGINVNWLSISKDGDYATAIDGASLQALTDSETVKKVTILDTNGRIMEASRNGMSPSAILPRGIYVARIDYTDGTVATRKFIK